MNGMRQVLEEVCRPQDSGWHADIGHKEKSEAPVHSM